VTRFVRRSTKGYHVPLIGQGVWLSLDLDWSKLDLVDEQMGTKDKYWVWLDSGHWLVKLCRVVDGRTLGEDWAEWLVHRLGGLLGVPTAVVEPALIRVHGATMRGLASLDVRVDQRLRLVHGNELLAEVDDAYVPTMQRENLRYTVSAVRRALDGIGAPAEIDARVTDAFDAWAGYLVLDAWVAGRDRHHENWAAERTPEWSRLAPSFDHGNALGFQETDEATVKMAADSERVARWAERGRSHHFAGRPGLVALACEALAASSDGARAYWQERIEAVRTDDVLELVAKVPRDLMSEDRGTFIASLLETNQRRLADGLS
jgi:hypothetical protein